MARLITNANCIYIFGDYSNAAKYSGRCKDYGIKQLAGAMTVPRHFLIRGLTAVTIASATKVPWNRRWKLREARWVLNKMQMWHKAGNPNLLHMIQLLDTEIKSLNRVNKNKAEALYKKAIQSAARIGSLNDKALAHELAGRFYLNVLGDTYWAAYQFGNAIESYRSWGAEAKVNDIMKRYGSVVSWDGGSSDQATSQDLTFVLNNK